MVYVRGGLGYDTIQGALSIITGTTWTLVIALFISSTDSEVIDQMFGGIMLVWAIGPIFVLVGIYSTYSDRKKRMHLGFVPYWGTFNRSFFSLGGSSPPKICRYRSKDR